MNTPGRQILLTDDDAELRLVLSTTLIALGFDVVASRNGEQALREFETHRFDAVLLDVNMPGIGGVETCRRIKKKAPRVPVLMLTVRDREGEKIEAFEAGADDYITKPFSVPELAARLRSAVRRANPDCWRNAKPVVIGEIELDSEHRTVKKGGKLLRLTQTEYELLHYLMKHPGIPVDHQSLLSAVWGADWVLQREYLHTFVSQLRKKVEEDPAAPQYLFTEVGFGYRFRGTV